MKKNTIIWIVLGLLLAAGAVYFLFFRSEKTQGPLDTSRSIERSEIKDFFRNYHEFSPYAVELTKFYKERDFELAWFDKDGLTEQSFQMYLAAVNSGKHGIGKPVPYRDELINLFSDEPSNTTVVPIDLMLTAQYFHYNAANFEGEVTERQTRALDWLIKREKTDPIQLLNDIVDNKSDIYNGEAFRKGYADLKVALAAIREKGLEKLEPIKSDKNKYEPGDSSEVISKIRERLAVLGDLATTNNSPVLDAELVEGIKSFQKRHGLEPDGIAGPGFFEELNVSGNQRVRQILANMERYRWMSDDGNHDYLFVNIPDYKLYAYENDSVVWEMNVVVGKDLNKTVVFSGDIDHIVFSPYWNIPASIVQKEILPGIERNPNYLAEKNMEIYGNSGGLPNIRQKPGVNNSLGKAKFMFPNSHSIYLHDSPAKSLFTNTERAYSHGCVRVANAEYLANYLLKDQTKWTPERIKEAMDLGKETVVNLDKPKPVYITYFTAFVDSEGKLNFRKDIYNRDSKLQTALFN